MSAEVVVPTWIVAGLLAIWIASAGIALVGVLWMARRWRRRVRERMGEP